MSGLVNGVLAGTGAFEICNRFDSERRVATEGFFWAASSNVNRSYSHLGIVSVAFGIRGEDSRTRASLAKELKVSIRSDVPALDPDRTGTGGF
jgi:hypothetical protein